MRTYGVGMRGGFLVIEGWVVSPIIPGESAQKSNVGERGSIDDSVILGNRLIEGSSICCTTH